MTKLVWDAPGERIFETGVDRGVLYVNGVAVAWSGLVSVSETSVGGESTPYYLDGVKYLNLLSDTEFTATIEAFTYPDEFAQCDGTIEFDNGLFVTDQDREPFGLSYRSLIGNDIDGVEHGYKIHLVYGALASPSPVSHTTLNESPGAEIFSWSISTTPETAEGFRPTAHYIIDSRKMSPEHLEYLEDILYGRDGTAPLVAQIPSLADLLLLVSSPLEDYGIWDAGTADPEDMTLRMRDAGLANATVTQTADMGFLDTQEGFLIADGANIPAVAQQTIDGGDPANVVAPTQTFDGGAP